MGLGNGSKYWTVYGQLVLRKFKRVCTLLKPRASYLNICRLYQAGFFHASYWYYRIFYKQLFHTGSTLVLFNKNLYKQPSYYFCTKKKQVAVADGVLPRYYYHRYVKYKRFLIHGYKYKKHGLEYQQRLAKRGQCIMHTRSTSKLLLTNTHKIKQFIHANVLPTMPVHFIFSLFYLLGRGKKLNVDVSWVKIILAYQGCLNKQVTANTMRCLNLFFITFYQSLRHMHVGETRHFDRKAVRRLSYQRDVAGKQYGFWRYYTEYAYGRHTRYNFKRGLVYNTDNLFRFYAGPYNIILNLLGCSEYILLTYCGVSPWIPSNFFFQMHDYIKYDPAMFWFFYYVGALTSPYDAWGDSKPYTRPRPLLAMRWFTLYNALCGIPPRVIFCYRQRLVE